MTPEMRSLYEDIKPYFDFTKPDCFKTDTPDEIRQKAKRYDELRDAQIKEANRIEGIPV